MEKIKIEIPSRKDLIFEGEQIARITDPLSGVMVLWKTKGGKYVLERRVGNDKRAEIYYSVKEASLIIDTYGAAGKKLIKAAQSKDKAFVGCTEERIE
ncbi:MAG: hypothetical protein GTO24_19690 [candidate division Zixibacteria bacterium]|nr:hypothetical protein [candidate division Zixibacteria bacterium]